MQFFKKDSSDTEGEAAHVQTAAQACIYVHTCVCIYICI